MKTYLFIFNALFLLFVSCAERSDIELSLQLSGENLHELEQVLTHYQQEGDREKLAAARFLIGNMQDKKAVINRSNTSFLKILDRIDSMREHGNAELMEEASALLARFE